MQQENQLAKLDHNEVMSMAKLFVDSKMFTGMDQVAMAFVKIQAGLELGIAPFAAMSGIHIIKGRATVGAGLMAGKIKSSGKYDYTIAKHDDTICSIDFYENGKKKGTETFTSADAKKAGTQNMDKFPKNMLFARAISNGMRFYCPDLYTMPVYTPEEMNAVVTEDISHEDVTAAGIDTVLNNIEKETDIEKLATIFKALSKDDQKKYKDATAKRKAFLTPGADIQSTETKITDESQNATA